MRYESNASRFDNERENLKAKPKYQGTITEMDHCYTQIRWLRAEVTGVMMGYMPGFMD